MTKQLDADNNVNEQVTEIPAEYADQFEGVSKETALEILREAGLLPDQSSKENNQDDKASGEDQTGKQGAVQQPDGTKPDETNKTKPDETKPNEEDPDKVGGDVRVALKIERQKRQQLQAELDKLKTQQPQVQQPVQQPVTQPPGQQPNTPEYEDLLHDESVRRFEKKYDRKPDFFDPEGKDLAKFNVIVRQVDKEVETLQAEETERQAKQTAVNNDYVAFTNEVMADDLYEANKQKVIQAIDDLDPNMQNMLVGVVNRLEAGRGTAQDVYIAKSFWNQIVGSSVAQTGNTDQQQTETQTEVTVIPVQPAPTNKIEKAKQMEAHPRTDQIKGSNTQGGYTVAELERMVQEKEWHEIPKDIQDLLLGKK
jgi:hypothetical protein